MVLFVLVFLRKSVSVLRRELVPGLGLWQWEHKWVRHKEPSVESVTVFGEPLDFQIKKETRAVSLFCG